MLAAAQSMLQRWGDVLLRWWIGVVTGALNWHINGFWAWVNREYWMPNQWPVSKLGDKGVFGPDQLPNMQGVDRVESGVKYGAHPDENLQIAHPTADMLARREEELQAGTRTDNGVILYAHGGGFVIASSEVLIHSVTMFCRSGFTVYSINYPLAPKYPFPAALVSTLRAMSWLRVEKGIDRISVLGDSAGATLTCMAATLVCNPSMLKDFADAIRLPELRGLDFPAIDHSACLYGLLDRDSWRRRLPTLNWLEHWLAERGIAACLFAYQNPSHSYADRTLLMDLDLRPIKHLPRTLFIGATYDPLVYSSLLSHGRLKAEGHDVHCKLFPGRHGFFGVPPQWTFGAWRTDCAPSALLLRDFFRDGSVSDIGHDPPDRDDRIEDSEWLHDVK